MQLEYVPPAGLTPEQLSWLNISAVRGGWTVVDLAEAIGSGRWQVFSFPRGLLAISTSAGVMTIEATYGEAFGPLIRSLKRDLLRLASHYKCYKIETLCFDERVAQAMLRIKGRATAWQISWDVEGTDHGQ